MSLWRGMLTVYGDESHDDTRQRVYAVAGLLGDEKDWKPLRSAGSKERGARVFHAAECESKYAHDLDGGEKHRANLKLYAD
jgi:hypothetical protein